MFRYQFALVAAALAAGLGVYAVRHLRRFPLALRWRSCGEVAADPMQTGSFTMPGPPAGARFSPPVGPVSATVPPTPRADLHGDIASAGANHPPSADER